MLVLWPNLRGVLFPLIGRRRVFPPHSFGTEGSGRLWHRNIGDSIPHFTQIRGPVSTRIRPRFAASPSKRCGPP